MYDSNQDYLQRYYKIVIYDIILQKNAGLDTIITKDFVTYENENNVISSIYDTTYNDIIKRII